MNCFLLVQESRENLTGDVIQCRVSCPTRFNLWHLPVELPGVFRFNLYLPFSVRDVHLLVFWLKKVMFQDDGCLLECFPAGSHYAVGATGDPFTRTKTCGQIRALISRMSE